MKKIRQAQVGVIAALVGLSAVTTLLSLSAHGETAATVSAAATEVLRTEIRTPLVAAQALFDVKNIPGAIAKIGDTDAVPNKTAYEIFAIERTRGNYYLAADDKVNAAKSFEAVVAANYLKRADQLSMIEAIGELYFQASDYAQTITWLNRYIKDGGLDARAQDVLNRAYFGNKDYTNAVTGFSNQVNAQIAAGKTPDEQIFQFILNCKQQLNDKDGMLVTLEHLNSYYPSTKNWIYLLSQIHTKPGFSNRLYLDIFRLKQELGLMKTGAEYVDMAELATRAALPAEAQKALNQGFAAGLLDKGTDAKKHSAALETANKRAEEDLKTMQQGEVSANKSKDGTGLVNLGMAYATAGQYDQGASLIAQGIAKGGLPHLEEAKLHLGLVYYWGGKKDQALKQLATVAGADGAADLARYWITQINRPLAK